MNRTCQPEPCQAISIQDHREKLIQAGFVQSASGLFCNAAQQTAFRQGPRVPVTTRDNKLDKHEAKVPQKGFLNTVKR